MALKSGAKHPLEQSSSNKDFQAVKYLLNGNKSTKNSFPYFP